ncbi:hypothetical protein OAM83_00345 [Candidatus Pelagibacter sp.]|jgi:hypothetical protein|nr:hypothetical protein [Candidatus Pelagibacter sp.]
MKKVIYFFLILIIFVFLFDIKFLNYFFSKKLSNWTEHTSEVNISKLNYFKGELEINKIQIKNNKNFESKIFDTNLITINFDFKSLFSNLVLINSVVIIDPIFYFEIKDINTKSNKKDIIDNLNIIDNSDKVYSAKKKDKNFLISNLLIKNSKVIIKYPKNIKDLHIDLSEITFSNVGNAGKENDNNFQHYKDAIKLILSDIFFKIPDYNLRNLIKKKYKIE